MILVPTAAAIMLAIAGGRAVPVTCHPDAFGLPFAGGLAYGLTYWRPDGTADHVELAKPCGELGSPLDLSNGSQATAVYVAALEASRVAGDGRDSTAAACDAIGATWRVTYRPALAGGDTVGRAIARAIADTFEAGARTFYGALPAMYHERSCSGVE